MNPGMLKFVVLPGNNSGLIREALLRRSHKWEETTPTDTTYHFKWQPVSYGIKFDQVGSQIPQSSHAVTKQLVNHFEFHGHLTEKSKLFKSLTEFALKRRENIFDYVPVTFFVEIDISNPKLFSKALLPFMNSYYALEDIKKKVIKYYVKIEEHNAQHGSESNPELIVSTQDDPFDEQFIFRHFYNNKRGLIK